jgi:hypothetical protein
MDAQQTIQAQIDFMVIDAGGIRLPFNVPYRPSGLIEMDASIFRRAHVCVQCAHATCLHRAQLSAASARTLAFSHQS